VQELTGKIALVTGASRGIGQAVARLLSRHGATVAVNGRDEQALQQAADAIRDEGGEALAVPGDLTADGAVDHVFDEVERVLGRLDILVNNAGRASFGPVEELSVEDLRQCMELNVIAVHACMQRAVPMMKESGGTGKIINIGSVRSHWTEAGDAGAYNASKAGLRAMTESVARQLHGTGVNIAVGMVSPGVVDTLMTNPEQEPRPDWLRPETVAQAVLHAVTAPPTVNIFETILFPMGQRPW